MVLLGAIYRSYQKLLVYGSLRNQYVHLHKNDSYHWKDDTFEELRIHFDAGLICLPWQLVRRTESQLIETRCEIQFASLQPKSAVDACTLHIFACCFMRSQIQILFHWLVLLSQNAETERFAITVYLKCACHQQHSARRRRLKFGKSTITGWCHELRLCERWCFVTRMILKVDRSDRCSEHLDSLTWGQDIRFHTSCLCFVFYLFVLFFLHPQI